MFYENGTVAYREDTWYAFDREMSAGPEEDTFTNVNLPMLVRLQSCNMTLPSAPIFSLRAFANLFFYLAD